jgi:hypothetical protein
MKSPFLQYEYQYGIESGQPIFQKPESRSHYDGDVVVGPN